MTDFIGEKFLLSNPTAVKLYHDYAAKMPIYDYHCHVNLKDIRNDRHFENITQLWIAGDHYKWRVMRSNGVPEEYCTGNASDRDKFQKFAEALPKAIGNPMYHWCHMELKKFFGYEGVLNGETAQEVWDLTTEKLADPSFSVRNLIKMCNVAMIGSTDDPCDDLEDHKIIRSSGFETAVLPNFRPDPALNPHKSAFPAYIKRLSSVANIEIKGTADVAKALAIRMEYFDEVGCRTADHGLDYIMYREATPAELDDIFNKALEGKPLTLDEIEAYQTDLLIRCAREYYRLGWAMQLHFSATRNPNSKGMQKLGPDSGYDCIAVTNSCAPLFKLMDALERENHLPKTILYSLNPNDDQWIDTLLGAFQGPEIPGKIQHGTAWWFNDNKVGMQNQMISLANLGLLGNFIGMLTDGRSFLSYIRFEYFRRILCDLIGRWVENGEYPNDMKVLGGLVEDICGNNAKRYFNL